VIEDILPVSTGGLTQTDQVWTCY